MVCSIQLVQKWRIVQDPGWGEGDIMKATKILQFLSEGNIDALRAAAEIEVMSEKIGSPNAVKAREKLAKMAVKAFAKTRPYFAGAWERDGHQIITDGFVYGEYYDIVPGLSAADNSGRTCNREFDGRKIDISIDVSELSKLSKLVKDKDKPAIIRIDKTYFQAKYIINTLSTLTGELTYRLNRRPGYLRVDGENGFVVIMQYIPIPYSNHKPIKIYEEEIAE